MAVAERGAIAEAAFQPVMATGILSLVARTVGWSALSLVLMWLAIIAYAVLLGYEAIRLDRRPIAVLGELRTGFIFSYLTLVAAGAVLASDVLAAGWSSVFGWVLLAVSGLFWVAIMVVILFELVALGSLHPRSEAQGGWLLAVVAPQSLCILALALAGGSGAQALRVAALVLWVLASVLYLPLAAVRVLRLERARDTVRELRSDDWILMGALAISTLAAARLLVLSAGRQLGAATGSVLSVLVNVEFVLACAWIPLLAWGEIEHLRRGARLREFAAGRWSTIFPLGMFSLASKALAQHDHLDGLNSLGAVFFAFALATWLATVVLPCVRGGGARG
jgi:tellurite resistance protein TehA-like permease